MERREIREIGILEDGKKRKGIMEQSN